MSRAAGWWLLLALLVVGCSPEDGRVRRGRGADIRNRPARVKHPGKMEGLDPPPAIYAAPRGRVRERETR